MTRGYRAMLAICTTAIAISVTAAPAYAQRGRGGDRAAAQPQLPPKWKGDPTVKGKVTDESGKPIAGARVTFVLAELNTGFFATTKKNGEFEAEDLKTGEWRVQIDAPNFVVARQTIAVAAKNLPLALVVKRDN